MSTWNSHHTTSRCCQDAINIMDVKRLTKCARSFMIARSDSLRVWSLGALIFAIFP